MSQPRDRFRKIVVFLESRGPGGPATIELSHWAYGWLGSTFPWLAEAIHGRRAVAISPLLLPSGVGVAESIVPGGRYAVRFAFLAALEEQVADQSKEVRDLWSGRAWPAIPPEIQLGPQRFRALGWTEDPSAHPLAGHCTVGDLIRWGQRHAGETLRLTFLTPTFFKATYRPPGAAPEAKPIDLEIPLPDPVRIINSLAGRWDRFAPFYARLPEELLDPLRGTVAISRHVIQTEIGWTKGGIRGFVGWADFVCLAPQPEVQAAFATLWRLADYSGVGNKTALGFGLVHLGTEPARSPGPPPA